MTGPGAVSRRFAIGLLLFGMLWLAVALMQDVDMAGRLKAVILLGAAVGAAVLTLTVEAIVASRPTQQRLMTWTVGLLLAVLAFFAALTPSHLTQAEAVAAMLIAAAPLAFNAAGIRLPISLDRLPTLLAILCAVLALNRLRIAAGYLHDPDMEDIGTTTIAAVHAVLGGHNPYAAPIDLHPEYPDYPGYKYLR